MKTATNIESRRMSVSGYKSVIQNRERREAQELRMREEETRRDKEQKANVAQKFINDLCKEIQQCYSNMVNCGKDMQHMQDLLAEKQQEEELFHSTADDRYALTKVDEKDVHKMRFRKAAYHALPILDCIFAFLALYPIMTSKLAETSRWGEALAVPVGFVLSAGVGYGLSILSRIGVSSLDDGDKSSVMYILKRAAIGLSMFALPLMYIVGEFYFSNGETWVYSLCFAIVSFIIQLLIVSGYKHQLEALDYFDKVKQNKMTKARKLSDEQAMQGEINNIKDRIQNILNAFNDEYLKFRGRFTDLATERNQYIAQFGEEPKCYLNQLIIFFGNLVCFRRMAIPFYHEENGAVSAMTFVDFPHVIGGHEIEKNYDFVYLDYMLQKSQSGLSLSETIKAIDEGYRKKLSMSQETNRSNDTNPGTDNEPTGDENVDGIWED